MSQRRALVVGLGIAGMATALSLLKAGWTPIIVERAVERRKGGYFIGLFPEGQQAAKDLGIYSNIHTRDPNGVNWDQDIKGNRDLVPGFVDQPGSPKGVLRGDIEAGLWKGIEGRIEVRFATGPVKISERQNEVVVELEDQSSDRTYEETFDLVIGADGLRSTVRKLSFGRDSEYLKSLEAVICAFEFTRQVPEYGAQDGVTVSAPRHALWVFPFSDRPPTALFTYRVSDIDREFERPHLEVLRDRFADLSGHGVVNHALGELAKAQDFLFDSVHQVRMKNWYNGRIVLVGDAAWCLTLYSGMGVTAGLKGGYELGSILNRFAGNITDALKEWELGMKPFVRRHQRLAYLKRELFVPSNGLTATIRKTVLRVAGRKASGTASLARNAGYLVRAPD